MTAPTIVWLAVALALCTQLLLTGHVARRWRSVPHEIPYGTLTERNFLWGPRAIVWVTPALFVAVIAVVAVIIRRTPLLQEQPLMAVPFVLIALSMPLVQRSIDEKIDAAIRRDS